jgi:hypothetical protein
MKEPPQWWNTKTKTKPGGGTGDGSHQAFKTHIKSIAIFIHEDNRVEVAQGHFANKEGDIDLTKLESRISFFRVKASMSMKEKLRQV